MPKLQFKEPQEFDYLYIDANNRVHLIFPLVGGDEVAVDNTCKTALELDAFFYGKASHPSALDQLRTYQQALEQDISAIKQQKELLPGAYAKLLREKQERLRQINQYLPLVESLVKDPEIVAAMKTPPYPSIPAGGHKVLKDATNAFSLRLSPFQQDTFLRFESPFFSVERSDSWKPSTRGLGFYLRDILVEANINKKSSREGVVKAVLREMHDAAPINVSDSKTEREANFNLWKKAVEKELQKIDPQTSLELSAYRTPLDYEFVNTAITADEQTTPEDWVEGIISSAVSEDFWPVESHFYESTGPLKKLYKGKPTEHQPYVEKMSIKVQYFMAEVAFFCKVNGISTHNFAEFFDKDQHSKAIANLVMENLGQGKPIEDALLKYINDHHEELGMSHALDGGEQAMIVEKYNQHFTILKDSPHFDEFFILDPTQKGNIYTHKGRISCHFLEFYARQKNMDLGELGRNVSMEGYADILQSEVSSNRLPHKNELIISSHQQINQLNQNVLKHLAEAPSTLVNYLLQKTDGIFNFELLERETCNAIVYNARFPQFLQQITTSTLLDEDKRKELLTMLDRPTLERGNRAQTAWSYHAAKPLLDIELTKVVAGIQASIDSYNAKRAISWWKGSPSSARVRQLREMTEVKEEIQKLLKSDPHNQEEILEKLIKSIGVLDKIEGEIGKEWNLFQSTLQLEVRALRTQLTALYQLQAAEFQNGKTIAETIQLEINCRVNSLTNPYVRDIVLNLPAHYQTKESIALFAQLTVEEAVTVANYLNIGLIQINAVDKTTLLSETIPDTFNAYPVVGEVLLDAFKVDALLRTNPQQNFTITQIQNMVELAQRIKMTYIENGEELGKLPEQTRNYLIKFEEKLHKVRTEPTEFHEASKGIKEKLRTITEVQEENSTLKLKV